LAGAVPAESATAAARTGSLADAGLPSRRNADVTVQPRRKVALSKCVGSLLTVETS